MTTQAGGMATTLLCAQRSLETYTHALYYNGLQRNSSVFSLWDLYLWLHMRHAHMYYNKDEAQHGDYKKTSE